MGSRTLVVAWVAWVVASEHELQDAVENVSLLRSHFVEGQEAGTP